MPLVNSGLTDLVKAGLGEAITLFNNANSYIGVGGGASSTTAYAATQTDLQGATKFRKAMDATYPQRSGLVVTYRSTFGTADANQVWNEWAVFNASTAGTMLCRKQEAMGTKTSAEVWVATATLTYSVGT